MRVSDRNLLVDEIERKLKEGLPDKDIIVAEVVKDKELQDQINDMKAVYRKYLSHKARMQAAEDTMNASLLAFRKSIDNPNTYLGYSGGNKHEQLINEIYAFGKEKYSIPSRQKIETTILFASDEANMNELVNKVIEQLKND